MKHVDLATYQAYHNCDNEEIHQEFDPSNGLPESMVTLLEARYGAEIADMCQTKRSSIVPHYRDEGYERNEYTASLVKDEVLDGIEHKRINTSFERSNVPSEVECNILSNVMGLSYFSIQRNRITSVCRETIKTCIYDRWIADTSISE